MENDSNNIDDNINREQDTEENENIEITGVAQEHERTQNSVQHS